MGPAISEYLAVYDDGYAEVPSEVSAVFEKICTSEFCELQKKRSWLSACLVMVEYLYGTAPARVVYRMYRRRRECRVSFEEFTELFRSVPEEENICVLDGDRISLQGIAGRKRNLSDAAEIPGRQRVLCSFRGGDC